MQKVNEFRFYELASLVHPLADLESPLHYQKVWFSWWPVRPALDQIFAERPLSVATPSAIRLYNAIDAIVPRDFMTAINKLTDLTKTLKTDPQADVIEPAAALEVQEATKQFETILAAEVLALDTYFVSQKGSYRTSDLIDRAEIIFPTNIRAALPVTTVTDIQQAGRCVALDMPTGAGFHLMRAIEGVMSLYYARVLGKAMPTRMRNWGIYIKKLRESGKAEEKIVGFLEHIKDNYRNPITHPEVILTEDEAEILLGVAASAIRQMIVEIQRLDKVQPSTAPIQTTTETKTVETVEAIDAAPPENKAN